MVSENGSKAKGGIGSLIVMVERNGKGEIVNYKAIQNIKRTHGIGWNMEKLRKWSDGYEIQKEACGN